jgi:hypothetical protein
MNVSWLTPGNQRGQERTFRPRNPGVTGKNVRFLRKKADFLTVAD